MDPIAERLVSRLQTDPNDAEAYDALKAHYREVGDLASLTNLIAGWAAFQSDPVRASQGYLEASRVAATTGRHPARQVELLRQAAERDVTHRDAVLELVSALAESDDPHSLAEFLDQHLRAMEEQAEAHDLMAALYARLGAVWGATFERADVARRCYERALELDANNPEVVHGARRLAQQSQDAPFLARVCGFQAGAEVVPERKLELYLEQAALYLDAAPDLDGAVQALRSAHQLAPGDGQVMQQLADCLMQRATLLEGDDAARDLRRVAELHYQLAQAVPPNEGLAYLELALSAAPGHDGALHMLEQLAGELGRQELLPKYWLGYLAHAAEGPELDQRRVYMAQAYDRAGQLDHAIACLEQVRTEGLATQQLNELRARRGPRQSAPPPARQPELAEDATSPSVTAVTADSALERPSAKPPRSRAPSGERPLDLAPVLLQLRRQVRDAIAARRQEDAVKHCTEILELEPGDAEAFALLESYYRKTQDYPRLRELLLASTQISGVPVAVRQQRLREVAAISEAKLKDVEGAIEVWRSVVALDPADLEAAKSLKRLLQRTARWDELALVLEREALATQDTDEKVALLAQIAAIHRDKRKDPHEAAEALRQLLSLRADASVRDELCELLLSIESFADAVPLLRLRIADAAGEREQLRLLRQLAQLLEAKLVDPEAAYEVHERVLQLRPKDTEALEHMQRIDERSGNTVRLLDTLERRAALSLRDERVTLLISMAETAQHKLEDLERASRYYRTALELDPTREGLLDALSDLFEAREHFLELSELLAQVAAAERDPARRVELLVRRARLLRGPLGQLSEAAEVYRTVLDGREDAEALEFLLETAREEADAESIAAWTARLAALAPDPSTRRDLLYERAQVLVTELGRPRDAVQTLREIVETVDPDYDPAIEWLAELSGNLGDNAGLASALMRRLHKSTTQDARVALAKRLADLYEHELAVKDHAITALQVWTQADARDVAPQRRLRRLLEDAGRPAELIVSCDALAELEPDPAAAKRATLDAAQVAFAQLRDVDGAWKRLAPMVERGVPEALQLLSAIARSAGRGEALAALCVQAAQAASSVSVQRQLWAAAARIYSQDLANPAQALEAALRLLATDLKSRDALTQVEESAVQSAQWTRLGPVYDRLLRAADSDAERIELLTRHADLLEQHAQNPSEALERILNASALAPSDETLVTRAERLAARTGRGTELLAVCEQQATGSTEPTARVEWLLRAARFAISAQEDSVRAAAYLEAALAATRADAALWELCMRAAVLLDDSADERDESQPMLRQLLAAHRRVAENCPPAIGGMLMLRGSRLLQDRFGDERGSFDMLRQGSALFPLDEKLYDLLLEQAEALGRLDALDTHLSRAVDDALDPETAATILARRARLLEGPLARIDDAANVYAKLLQLRPDDVQAASKLRDSLRRAKRFQDLLLVIHRQMQRAKQPAERLELLKESAQVWELDLKNRWEALDAWRKVLEVAPRDAEAQRAAARLDRRSGAPPSMPDATGDPLLDAALASTGSGSVRPGTGRQELPPAAATEVPAGLGAPQASELPPIAAEAQAGLGAAQASEPPPIAAEAQAGLGAAHASEPPSAAGPQVALGAGLASATALPIAEPMTSASASTLEEAATLGAARAVDTDAPPPLAAEPLAGLEATPRSEGAADSVPVLPDEPPSLAELTAALDPARAAAPDDRHVEQDIASTDLMTYDEASNSVLSLPPQPARTRRSTPPPPPPDALRPSTVPKAAVGKRGSVAPPIPPARSSTAPKARPGTIPPPLPPVRKP